MKLSTRSRYGTRMMLDIALHGDNGPVRISEISQRQGVSVKYLEKLIRPLKKGKYIKSKRGPKGGHMLTRPPEQITVGEVVRLLEGDIALTECVLDGKVCANSDDCITRQLWMEASQAMYERLNCVTFADLIQKSNYCRPIA
ncbi:MAG: Rrf2 family transcriptional regulator [Desulfovibrionaceae bacterium]